MYKKIFEDDELVCYSLGEKVVEPFGVVKKTLYTNAGQEISDYMLDSMNSFLLSIDKQKKIILELIYKDYKTAEKKGSRNDVEEEK